MNRLVIAAVLAASTALTGAGAAVAAPPAPTIGPVVVGWWSATNRNPAVPAVAPADVGAKDLYVAGANDLPDPIGSAATGPVAIAALRFELPAGSSAGQLQLRLAGVHPPAVSLSACQATRAFSSAYDGSWGDAPTYDCANAGTARLTADGQVLIDGVDELRDGRDLSVVLVPGPLDRVVVAAPDAHTLTVTGGSSQVSAPPPLPAGAPVAPAGTAPLTSGTAPTGLAPAALPAAVAPPAQGAAQPPAVAPPGRARAAAASLPTRPWPALLTTLLLALLAFVPLVRTRSGVVGAGALGTRGVGRFRSERSGSVQDLA